MLYLLLHILPLVIVGDDHLISLVIALFNLLLLRPLPAVLLLRRSRHIVRLKQIEYGFGSIIIRSQYTPYSIYLRGLYASVAR